MSCWCQEKVANLSWMAKCWELVCASAGHQFRRFLVLCGIRLFAEFSLETRIWIKSDIANKTLEELYKLHYRRNKNGLILKGHLKDTHLQNEKVVVFEAVPFILMKNENMTIWNQYKHIIVSVMDYSFDERIFICFTEYANKQSRLMICIVKCHRKLKI